MTNKWIEERLNKYSAAINNNVSDVAKNIEAFANIVLDARSKGNTIYFAGNGASTTIASHASLDFTNQLTVKSHALNDPNFITCFANDFGYDDFMERSIKLYGEENDVAVLISSSGNSQNVVNAAKRAKEMGMTVVTFSGFSEENKLQALGDVNFWLDSKLYNVVECTHMMWLVMTCDYLVSKEVDKIGIHGWNL